MAVNVLTVLIFIVQCVRSHTVKAVAKVKDGTLKRQDTVYNVVYTYSTCILLDLPTYSCILYIYIYIHKKGGGGQGMFKDMRYVGNMIHFLIF